jgi:hypothetical protein
MRYWNDVGNAEFSIVIPSLAASSPASSFRLNRRLHALPLFLVVILTLSRRLPVMLR